MNNEVFSTVKYVVNYHNFFYHIKKGQLLKRGSVISKATHPVAEVELLKQELKQKNKVYETEEGYILRKNLNVGLLMGFNLCTEMRVVALDFLKPVVVNGREKEDVEIKEYLRNPNLIPSNSEFGANIVKYELKLEKIERFNVQKEFFQQNRTKDFSMAEKFVAESLLRVGVISNYKRGDDTLSEADIIAGDTQIEVVSCLNDTLREIRFALSWESAAVMDVVDIGRYLIPEGTKNKFTKKKYTSNYRLELAIVLIGNSFTSIKMIETLKSDLQNMEIKNDFQSIHFVIINPIESSVTVISGELFKVLSLKDIPVAFCEKERVNYEDVENDEMYLMSYYNVFSGQKGLSVQKGKDLREEIKTRKVWM